MLRSDYNKIIKLLKNYNANFIVREQLKNHLQIRLCTLDGKTGLDIFPVDEILITNDKKSKHNIEQRIKQSYIIVNNLCSDKKLTSDINLLRSKIYEIQLKFVLNTNNKKDKKMLMYGIDYPHTHPECIFDKKNIFPLKKEFFEGKQYPIPYNSKKHLIFLYGDFMSYPRWI